MGRDGRCGSRSRPGLWEGHVKVECGRAGCLPEAVISQESLFFLKQSENCMPPGGHYTSLFQYNPGYLNNWIWKHVTISCHKAEISAFLWGCIVSIKFNRYNERPGFSTLHYWTNNYPAITVKPLRYRGMHHSAGSWQRELTQQATCKIGNYWCRVPEEKIVRTAQKRSISKKERATHRWAKTIYTGRWREQTKRHISKEKWTCTHISTLSSECCQSRSQSLCDWKQDWQGSLSLDWHVPNCFIENESCISWY